jgi:hypothetical protein
MFASSSLVSAQKTSVFSMFSSSSSSSSAASLHLVAVLDGHGQPQADIPATGQYHPLHRLVQLAQLAHHAADMLVGGDEEDFVINLDDSIAARHDGFAAPEDCRNAGIGSGKVLLEFTQFVTDQRAVMEGAHRHQLRPSAGEIQHLEGTRIVDQALDIIGYQLLRADQYIHGQRLLREQPRMLEVLERTDPGDFGGSMKQRIGHLAGDHVGLVAAGDGQYHVRVVSAGLGKRFRIGGVTGHGTNVESILKILQHGRIFIDHGDVIRFVRQIRRHRAADLAGTQNDDLHG